jgi:hypothetical protein
VPKTDQVRLRKRRAIEARTLAGLIDDPDTKRQMLEVAEGYDKLAVRAEARENQSPPHRRQ